VAVFHRLYTLTRAQAGLVGQGGLVGQVSGRANDPPALVTHPTHLTYPAYSTPRDWDQ
jgi:hypothetical protein